MIDDKRLRSIKNHASVIPEPHDVLVLELVAEIEQLQALPSVDFVANIIYQHENPGSIVAWFQLVQHKKDEYRGKARQTIESFRLDQAALESETRFRR